MTISTPAVLLLSFDSNARSARLPHCLIDHDDADYVVVWQGVARRDGIALSL
jgi:hypothetical protein